MNPFPFVTFVPSWLYPVRSGARAGVFAVALAVLTSCASAPPSPAKIAEFSQAWKTAGPGERGYLVRIDLVREHLAGKEQAEVLEFLGAPDGDEGRAFVYRLGLASGGEELVSEGVLRRGRTGGRGVGGQVRGE